MKNRFTYVLTALLMMSAVEVGAVPARPGIRTYTQPDGTVLNVQRFGDERAHVYMTEDNYPLAEGADGALYYATVDADGKLQPSTFLASNISRRQAPAKSFLALLQQDTDVSTLLKARRAHSSKLPQAGMGRVSSSFPTKGEVKGLAVLVEYKNQKFKISNPKQYFSDMLNKVGFSEDGGTGSAYDYFVDNSNGVFQPEFDVYGPITLPYDYSYYGANDQWGNDDKAEMMAIHAANILDPDVDFTQYDTDNDGLIDNMYIFYAGEGEAGSGSSDTVWPHSWDLHEAYTEAYMYDGVRLDHYACSNELEGGTPDGVGTFVHEFSHVMGLPDLYDTEYNHSASPQYWNVLDVGCYNNNSRTPLGYSIYERNALGWLTPDLIDGRASVELKPVNTSNTGFIIQTSKENEFYLFENRQQTGWDAYAPGHGMMIWHIDFDQSVFDYNTVNNTKNHQYVDIVEANNNPSGKTTAMAGYPWPGTSNKTSFTSVTSPAFKDWSGNAINLPITDIAEKNGVITFDVKGGWFEMAAPSNIAVSNITASSFTVKWDAVEHATTYQINVYTKSSNGRKSYVSGYEGLDLGDVTEYTVSHLRPDTEYYFTLKASEEEIESQLSEETSVTTGPFVFAQASVEVLSPENVSASGFDARWEAMTDAVSYNLTVQAINEGAEVEHDVNFGEGTTLSLPDGWYQTGGDNPTYVTTGNAGAAIPSFKFAKDGVILLSPDFGAQIVSISFWCKGVNVSTSGSSLDVQVSINDAWQTVERIVLPTKGTTYTLTDIPTGAQMMRFVYNKANGNCALDDVCIKCQVQSVSIVEGYNALNVGNVTRYNVKGLPAGITKYAYSVSANNAAGEVSCESAEMKVDLSASSGISDVKTNANGKVEYFNLQGMPVSNGNLTPGIYIRRQGSSVKKVVVQ
jgi:M6 family metalloprotease-like protein